MEILSNLRNLDGLKKLFWEELNYERENKPLSIRNWPDSAKECLAEDPVLFASGGEGGDFHVVYCRLASKDLSRGLQRPVVNQLLKDHPYALFVFSNKEQSAWHFLNVKFDEKAENRRIFRRITVRPGAGLRTATERLQKLDLAELPDKSPLAIQSQCDTAFDVEAVTKDFFREIANWYFWALKNVQFPKDAPKEADGHDHISVIRLITRLIFCWFLKEKGLIPETLFDERMLAKTLTGFEPTKSDEKESVFYRAILQNLFFATLNTEMDKRGWTKEEQNFMAHSLYRHRDCFSEPKTALDLFKEIPFLNGGLFECLDKDLGENAKPRYVRIDGFSRRADSQPVVPDFLFFGPEREMDLSADYGDKKFKKVRVRGLIDTLQRYHFTIEENTPIEQEVALDPELSGKVFENLLAAYNPETGATARKQTGSFYTPREIVNYMVDEALIACLKEKLTTEHTENTEEKLRHLFAYNDEPHRFTAKETEALIAAIDGLKTIDPAVGSGAFPMGILHKLVFILGKLDPRNEKWKERQISRVRDTMAVAEKIDDATARERAVQELEQQITGITEAFEHNELDYGRKLYLIENCIYGVDIQPIAVQISKMRFFISLIVDQKIDDALPNRGVRPLPNLETKFVAANTLIGVNRPGQQLLRNRDIDTKEAQLRDVRRRHFLARNLRDKRKCRDDDARLRTEIAELLKGDGWDTATAKRLASWNPYDQNASADFFDAEWMFGIEDGFDVAIGNPPYGAEFPPESIAILRSCYESVANSLDSFIMFIERAARLLKAHGALAYIVPSGWVSTPSSRKLRTLFVRSFKPVVFASLPYDSFVSAYVDTMVVVSQRLPEGRSWADLPEKGVRLVVFPIRHTIISTHDFRLFEKDGDLSLWKNPADDGFLVLASRSEASLISKLRQSPKCFDDYIEVMRGIETYNPVPIKQCSSPKPAFTGDIYRYQLVYGSSGYIDYLPEIESSKPWRFFGGPRILLRQLLSRKFRFQAVVIEKPFLTNQSVQSLIARHQTGPSLNVILAILNSRLLSWFFCQVNMVARRDDFPKTIIKQTRELPAPELSLSAAVRIGTELDKLVPCILTAKQADSTADTTALEREIDGLVYALYGLTEEEIRIVEGAAK